MKEKLKPRSECAFCRTKLEKIPSDSCNYNWYYCSKCDVTIKMIFQTHQKLISKGRKLVHVNG